MARTKAKATSKGLPKGQNADPTPEEIRAECWRIQSEWDEVTERIRAGCFAPRPIIVAEQRPRLSRRQRSQLHAILHDSALFPAGGDGG